MDNLQVEVWDAGGKNNYLYTENRLIADLFKREYRQYGVYLHGSRIVGWQFYIPKRVVRLMIPRIAKLMKIETSKINDLDSVKF